ncbi:alpha/beta fold hydrolase [Chryseolinea serpens]|nr:alpha/beta hydrolase [Chryseolinea serpens]
MKKTTLFIFLGLPLLIIHCEVEKRKIDYGSNDGAYISIRGKKIYYEEYGKGVPLLLLSGGGHSRSIKDFARCIPGLSQHFRIIAPDTPSQGRSEQPDSISYEILTETMSQLIDSLSVDSLYVMGWSDGGIVGILLAERRADKVKKVIAVGANNGKRGFNIPPGIPLDSVVPPSKEIFEKLNKQLIEDYSKLPGKDWVKLLESLNKMVYADEYFSRSIYDRIKIPVMIVVGDRDDISIAHGEEMYKSIPGSQFCVLPHTSHEVFKEQPELINRVAIGFFNDTPPKISAR